MTTQTIQVQNVKCEGCAANIKKALAQVQGVEQVNVDVAQGTVEVNGQIVLDKIFDVLTEAGYPPIEARR